MTYKCHAMIMKQEYFKINISLPSTRTVMLAELLALMLLVPIQVYTPS